MSSAGKITKLLFAAFLSCVVVYMIAGYFNEQGISGIFGGEPTDSSDIYKLNPYIWDMDSADEISIVSENVTNIIFYKSRFHFFFHETGYISPNQEKVSVNIERNSFLNMAFWANSKGLLNIRFAKKGTEDNPESYVSEALIYGRGWNRIKKDLYLLKFFTSSTGESQRIDWDEDGPIAGKIRFDFRQSDEDGNYIIIDHIKIQPREKLTLRGERLNVWSEGRNVYYDQSDSLIKPKNTAQTAVLDVYPLGFGPNVKEVVFRLIADDRLPMNFIFFYRIYQLDEFVDREPSVSGWIHYPTSGDNIRIKTEGRNLIECRIVIPPYKPDDRVGINKVVIEAIETQETNNVYFTQSLKNVLPAFGRRIENEAVSFPPLFIKTIQLSLASSCFQEVNYYRAHGYAISGRIKPGVDGNEASIIVKTYKNFVSLWIATGIGKDVESYSATKLIREVLPDARIVDEKRSARRLRQLFEDLAKRKVMKRQPSMLIFDRGILFFLAVVLIGAVCLFGLKDSLEMNFRLRRYELKYLGIGIIASVVLLMPLVFLLGMGSYRYVSLAELLSGLYRFGISAFIQELFRIIAIEYIVRFILDKKRAIYNRYLIALGLTSFFFSIGHLGYPGLSFHDQLSFLVVTLIAGMIFGYVYIKTKSITAPFILHLIANLFLFVFTTM